MKLTLERKLIGHKGSIYSVTFDPVDQQLYTGGGEGWLVKWDRHGEHGQLVADVGDQIFSLCLIDEQRLAAGTMNGDLYFLGRTSPRRKIFHQRGIYDLIHYGHYLISAGGDGKLGFWNLNSTEIEESMVISSERIRSLALNEDSSILAAGCSGGDIVLLSTATWRILDIISRAHLPSVFCLSWVGNDQLLSGGRDAHLKSWVLGNLDQPFQDLAAHWYTINHLQIHPDHNVLASASRDKTIRLWKLDNLEVIQTLDPIREKGHINSVNRLVWADDGLQLFAVSDDASISVWSTASNN